MPATGRRSGAAADTLDAGRRKALLKAGALQNAILNSASFLTFIPDERGVIRIVNLGAERMLGYAVDDVLNRLTPADMSDPQGLIAWATALSLEFGVPIVPGFEALVFKAARSLEDIHELIYIRRDGSRFAAMVSVTALRDATGTIIGYLQIGTDSTERKRLDQAPHETNLVLQKVKFVAERTNMSHELRCPLNAILGFTQLIESGSPLPTPGPKASIDQILRAGGYLLELINEILDLALIESGKMSLSLESMSLADVLGDCQTMIEPQASKRGIRVMFPSFDVACFVKADQTRVKQVFINLLSNAIKYNREGGQVEVTCSARSAERIRISFQDTGLGLSPDELTQLFQPFNRQGQQAGAEEGTGIGLVVSKRLVELMGGAIGVDNLMLVGRLLARRTDLHLLSARDGDRGIQIARAERPDVILMDINLPGISGLDALRTLADDPATAHIPVIALSANALPRDVERGLAAGFFRYLTKPIRIQEFMDTLDVALEFDKTAPAGAHGEERAE